MRIKISCIRITVQLSFQKNIFRDHRWIRKDSFRQKYVQYTGIRHFREKHRACRNMSCFFRCSGNNTRLRHTNYVREMFNFKHNFKFPFWSKIRMCVRTRIGKDGQYFSDPERKLGQAAQVVRIFFSLKRAAYSCLFLESNRCSPYFSSNLRTIRMNMYTIKEYLYSCYNILFLLCTQIYRDFLNSIFFSILFLISMDNVKS